jgi:cytochrome c oxidase cbb3-type subunit I
MNSPANNSRAEQVEIDATAKWPVLLLYSQAVAWLLIGGALEVVSSIQLHTPGFLGGCEWFTHGRVAAAASTVLVYGWGFNSAFAFALWLMARLSAAALRSGGWVMVACKFWNIALGLGMLGILLGGGTSYPLLELPRFVTLALLGAYALLGVWAVTTYSVRNTENVYASQWYIFAAVFFFPWLFLGAQTMLFCLPVRGVVQAVVNAWYVNGVYGLWFVPLALAALYYFIPKLTGRPVYNYYLAVIGFWWFVVCTAFAGGTRLIGGPVPAWISTLGIVANYMVVPAVVIVLVNLVGTLAAGAGALKRSVSLQFVALSVGAFVLLAALNLLLSFRGLAATLQFTLVPELRDWLAFYGVFSTAMFGAAYFILPRVTGLAWNSSALVRIHFICAAVGLAAIVVVLGAGGWIQGQLLNTATVPFGDIVKALTPWLVLRSVGLMLLLAGHVAFLINFAWMGLAVVACPKSAEPAVFANPPAMTGPNA